MAGQAERPRAHDKPFRESTPRSSELPPFPPTLPLYVDTTEGTLSLVEASITTRTRQRTTDILALWQDAYDGSLFVYDRPVPTRTELGRMMAALVRDQTSTSTNLTTPRRCYAALAVARRARHV